MSKSIFSQYTYRLASCYIFMNPRWDRYNSSRIWLRIFTGMKTLSSRNKIPFSRVYSLLVEFDFSVCPISWSLDLLMFQFGLFHMLWNHRIFGILCNRRVVIFLYCLKHPLRYLIFFEGIRYKQLRFSFPIPVFNETYCNGILIEKVDSSILFRDHLG